MSRTTDPPGLNKVDTVYEHCLELGASSILNQSDCPENMIIFSPFTLQFILYDMYSGRDISSVSAICSLVTLNGTYLAAWHCNTRSSFS